MIPLDKIGTIKTHARNKGMMQICVKNEDDEVIESFERNTLCLHIQRKASECCNHKINIKKVSHIEARTRDNVITQLFSNSAVIRNELQDVFKHAEKVGHLKLVVSGMISSNVEDFTMVLCNLGIIFFSTNKLKCRGFIPVLGVVIKKGMSRDSNHSIIVHYPDGKNHETMIFGSDYEQEEWWEAINHVRQITKDSYFAKSSIQPHALDSY